MKSQQTAQSKARRSSDTASKASATPSKAPKSAKPGSGSKPKAYITREKSSGYPFTFIKKEQKQEKTKKPSKKVSKPRIERSSPDLPTIAETTNVEQSGGEAWTINEDALLLRLYDRSNEFESVRAIGREIQRTETSVKARVWDLRHSHLMTSGVLVERDIPYNRSYYNADANGNDGWNNQNDSNTRRWNWRGDRRAPSSGQNGMTDGWNQGGNVTENNNSAEKEKEKPAETKEEKAGSVCGGLPFPFFNGGGSVKDGQNNRNDDKPESASANRDQKNKQDYDKKEAKEKEGETNSDGWCKSTSMEDQVRNPLSAMDYVWASVLTSSLQKGKDKGGKQNNAGDRNSRKQARWDSFAAKRKGDDAVAQKWSGNGDEPAYTTKENFGRRAAGTAYGSARVIVSDWIMPFMFGATESTRKEVETDKILKKAPGTYPASESGKR